VVSGPERDLVGDLLAPATRASLIREVQSTLGVSWGQATDIVDAFDAFVAQPLEKNLRNFRGQDLARRNPMIYTVRGVRTVNDWVDRVIEDRETSAIEAHLGTFMEETARIVSGGIKPGSGVDLQVEDSEGVIQLYAIQAASNTKNAGSRRSDIAALKLAAKPLRAAKRHVELNIAVLHGRGQTGGVRAEPEITVLASDEFWERITGIADFRARLLRASMILARLIQSRASDEVARLKAEATGLFGVERGVIDVEKLAGVHVRAAKGAHSTEE
jgi:hypothetical protein